MYPCLSRIDFEDNDEDEDENDFSAELFRAHDVEQ